MKSNQPPALVVIRGRYKGPPAPVGSEQWQRDREQHRRRIHEYERVCALHKLTKTP
jgi:hypothetical protein